MPETLKDLNSLDKIAEEGERLYQDRHKERLEREASGQFVAIDVGNGEAYVGEFPETALQRAKEANPRGIFHLIRIGAPGAFRVSYAGTKRHDFWKRPLRQSR